ncbi:MAG: NADH-ubiquinone dehydrogenase [Hyphomicrobiaceae bacterium]|nr:NADH-ubiquinone dehydrogenase [Hyphomicrobiaceae bacterium]
MSMFPMTDIPFAGAKSWQKLAAGFGAPAEAARRAGAGFEPAAGFIAMSAVGIAMASQAYGTWLGMMSAAAENSQRMFGATGGLREVAAEAAPAPVKARAVLRAVLTEPVEAPVAKVAKTVAAVPEMAPALTDLPAAPVELIQPPVVVVEPPVEKSPVVAKSPAPVSAPATLQPEDFRAPKPLAKPAAPDDLKAISGIGPKLESVLNGLGIWTYAQIAAFQPAEVAWIDDYLAFRGRISRDDWIGQASRLGQAKR